MLPQQGRPKPVIEQSLYRLSAAFRKQTFVATVRPPGNGTIANAESDVIAEVPKDIPSVSGLATVL